MKITPHRQRHAGRARGRAAPEPRRLPARRAPAHRLATSAASTACAARAPCAWTASLVRGCLMLAAQADGCRVETIEGLAESGALADLQRAFRRRTPCSAASARRGCCSRPTSCWSASRGPTPRRSARPSAPTTAAAPAITPSSRPISRAAERRAGVARPPAAARGRRAGYIGRTVVRPQTARLVAGRGTYTDDVVAAAARARRVRALAPRPRAHRRHRHRARPRRCPA